MITVYLAAKFTKGDQLQNIRRAIDCAEQLYQLGYAPFVPHLFAAWHAFHEHSWSEWMQLDDEWLRRCDALFRLPGESEGADVEVLRARSYGMPVFTDFDELEAWAEAKGVR